LVTQSSSIAVYGVGQRHGEEEIGVELRAAGDALLDEDGGSGIEDPESPEVVLDGDDGRCREPSSSAR
jgi:hypothetical protein